MSESLSLRKQIIAAFGEAAKTGGISGSGDGKVAMTSDGWNALGPLLDAVLAAAHAKGRAEGIGEAVKKAEDVRDNMYPVLNKSRYQSYEVSRFHKYSCALIVEDIRALLPTTGGSDADAKR